MSRQPSALQKLLLTSQPHHLGRHLACSVGCCAQAMGCFCAAVAFQDMLGASFSALSSTGPANRSSPGPTGTDVPELTADEQVRPMTVDSDTAEAEEVLQPSSPGR